MCFRMQFVVYLVFCILIVSHQNELEERKKLLSERYDSLQPRLQTVLLYLDENACDNVHVIQTLEDNNKKLKGYLAQLKVNLADRELEALLLKAETCDIEMEELIMKVEDDIHSEHTITTTTITPSTKPTESTTPLAPIKNYVKQIESIVTPCEFKLEYLSITCYADTNLSGKQIHDKFKNLSMLLPQAYHVFDELEIYYEKNYDFVFEPDTFKSIQFKVLDIEFNNTDKQPADFLEGNENKLETFYLHTNGEISSNVINQLNKIESDMSLIQFTGGQIELVQDIFTNSVSVLDFIQTKITKFESEAFAKMKCPEYIYFHGTNITVSLPDYAFRMTPCDRPLGIYFGYYIADVIIDIHFNDVPFAPNTFAKLGRQTRLIIYPWSGNELTYLDENVFSVFLEEDSRNVIDFKDGFVDAYGLDCSDCRNKWIGKDEQRLQRFKDLSCLDGKQFNDTSHFKNCS